MQQLRIQFHNKPTHCGQVKRETRVYPSMLADKQVPVLDLTKSTITSQADLQTAFQSIHLCSTKDNELSHGREESKEDEDTE